MSSLEKREFGTAESGKTGYLFTLENKNGMKIKVTDFGAALVSVFVPDKNGDYLDVVLGYDDTKAYEKGGVSFGAPVGRNANRIGGAAFEINGVTYELEKNDNGKNNLHSGTDYYNKRFWEVKEASQQAITFVLHSPDKDQGYPGTLDMHVTYELTDDNAVRMKYDAVPDQDTIINMTNHSYFNLSGHDSGDILNHQMSIDADYFTRADAESIPTGELLEVAGTPMDFRSAKRIGEGIDADYEATRLGGGYDHNWVLKNDGKFAKVAEAASFESGIVMEVWTDLPGMQVYTSNFLTDEPGKNGSTYQKRAAICFETQYFPDAIHHDHFAGPVCSAGEAYHTVTEYRFGIL